MARKLFCDCCHHLTDETDEEKKDWAHLNLSSIGTAAVFQKFDLCAECTGKIRGLLQKGS